jgi:hypothetical protein
MKVFCVQKPLPRFFPGIFLCLHCFPAMPISNFLCLTFFGIQVLYLAAFSCYIIVSASGCMILCSCVLSLSSRDIFMSLLDHVLRLRLLPIQPHILHGFYASGSILSSVGKLQEATTAFEGCVRMSPYDAGAEASA